MDRAPHSPHDAVFKHLLSHRATAKDFLDIHLPAPLRVMQPEYAATGIRELY